MTHFHGLAPILLWASAAIAHGPLHEQIERTTAEIGKQPGNARLYLKRGELHRHHLEWKLALADYDRAAQLDPTLTEVDLARGRLHLDSGQPGLSIAPLDRFLTRQPASSEGFLARAEARERMKQHRQAALDYDRAIAAGHIDPEIYLSRAKAVDAAGDPRGALNGLSEAIARLGPAVTLELAAVDLERRLRRWDAALVRLDRLAAQSSRKESWLARRGDVLAEAGRAAEASVAYGQALAALEALPEHLRRIPATESLERRVRAAAAR